MGPQELSAETRTQHIAAARSSASPAVSTGGVGATAYLKTPDVVRPFGARPIVVLIMETVEILIDELRDARLTLHPDSDSDIHFDALVASQPLAKLVVSEADRADDQVETESLEAMETDAHSFSPAGDASEQDVHAPLSIMDFNAFVSGEWSTFVPVEAVAESVLGFEDAVGDSESDANTLGTPDDDGDAESGFVDAFESGDDAVDERATAEMRRLRGLSLGAIASIRSAAVAASAAKLVRVKEKTQQVAQSKKQALSDFQKKGGLVGWLHGEPGDSSDAYGSDSERCSSCSSESEPPTETTAVSSGHESSELCQQPLPKGDTLRSASLPCDTQATLSGQPPAPRHHHSFPPQETAATGPATTTRPSLRQTPVSASRKKSLGGRQRASSLLGNFYEKVKKTGSLAGTPRASSIPRSSFRGTIDSVSAGDGGSGSPIPSTGRIALQPSPRKESAVRDLCSFGFDEFASASDADGRRSRQRAVSADNAQPSVRQQRLSTTLSLETEHLLASIEDARRPLLLNDCLADPKLAAEFVNTVMPDDSALLKLLYSIEEFEALVTTDSVPAFDVQLDYATTVIDRFLAPSLFSSDGGWSARRQLLGSKADAIRQTVEQLRLTNASSLPQTLFRSVYSVVYETLRDSYEPFKLTPEYAMLFDRQQQQQHDRNIVRVTTIDAILANEWCRTVFWAHLYRTAHHHRLSFLIDKRCHIDTLHVAFQDASKDNTDSIASSDRGTRTRVDTAYQRLVAQFQLATRKFLKPLAPVAVSVAAESLGRLEEQLCVDIGCLPLRCSDRTVEETVVTVAQVMDTLNVFASEVRHELTRLSFERFASFTASTLYRDFVANLLVQPPGPGLSTEQHVCDARSAQGDIVKLFRASRISFHQAPNDTPHSRTLSDLLWAEDSSRSLLSASLLQDRPSKAVLRVFAFATRDTVSGDAHSQPFTFVDLTDPHWSVREANETTDAALYQTLEHFLHPEAPTKACSEPTTADAHQRMCFNFVAGNGDSTVYGAVWRLPLLIHSNDDSDDSGVATQGICVVSKFPLVDSLRVFLHTLAHDLGQLMDPTPTPGSGSSDSPVTVSRSDLSTSMHNTYEALNRHLVSQQQQLRIDTAVDSPPCAMLLPPVDVSLRDLFDCLSLPHILRLVALVLLEKKVVLVASSYSVLLAVGEALRTLVYPLVWSHVYVPVLPFALKDYLHCPTPFIFGLHTSSTVRSSEVLPRPSDDLVVVDLDYDALTGGGDVFFPPTLSASLHATLVRLCRPHLLLRDDIRCCPIRSRVGASVRGVVSERHEPFPAQAIRAAFHEALLTILSTLEALAFRFEVNGKCVAVVDARSTAKTREWTSDETFSRFHAALLRTQAFSAYLSRCSEDVTGMRREE